MKFKTLVYAHYTLRYGPMRNLTSAWIKVKNSVQIIIGNTQPVVMHLYRDEGIIYYNNSK